MVAGDGEWNQLKLKQDIIKNNTKTPSNSLNFTET